MNTQTGRAGGTTRHLSIRYRALIRHGSMFALPLGLALAVATLYGAGVGVLTGALAGVAMALKGLAEEKASISQRAIRARMMGTLHLRGFDEHQMEQWLDHAIDLVELLAVAPEDVASVLAPIAFGTADDGDRITYAVLLIRLDAVLQE